MSATISWAAGAVGGASRTYFSSLMRDEGKALTRGLHRRDPELLDRLIEQYQYRLFRYLVFVTGDKARAEDFFQETWIRVLERGHQYDGRARFETWLFAIARHLVIDWQRAKKPQSLDALMEPREGEGDARAGAPAEFADDDPSALQGLLSRESEAAVQGALARLAAIYREVLLLRFHEELGLAEIASVLGQPISTVKSRLYRGLEALRALMEKETA